MKLLKNTLLSLGLIVSVVSGSLALTPATVSADAADEILKGSNATGQKSSNDLNDNLKTIVNIILFILGAIAVIVIVIGGLRYVLSGGDANAIKGAKDTILYAVVGLIVALLAYAIVNFVLTQFT